MMTRHIKFGKHFLKFESGHLLWTLKPTVRTLFAFDPPISITQK